TSPVSNTAGSSRTFNITVNQTVNVTWYINGTTVFNQTNVTDSSYTNTSAAFGIWNVTATANNANGAVSKQWTWNVTAAPGGGPNITGFTPSSPVSNTAGSSRNFKIIVNQTVNVTWYINGTTVFNQTNVTESSYTNTSAASGTWNVTAVANNTNGTVSQQWTWIVTAESVQQPALPAPTPVPGGGGGGAGVISPEPFINIERFEIMEEYLGANVPTSYILTTQDIVISEVLITPTKNFGTTSIRVELLKDLSNIEGITQPSGIVYKYANIWVGAKELEGEEGIIDAYIGFRVETGWLADNNLEDNSVKLLRWDGTKWFSLETVPKNRDGNFVYYESKTIGFSPFAIVAVPMYPSATVKAVETVETTTIETVLQKLAKEQTSQWLYIFIILILIGMLLYSLIYSRKIGEEFEKPIEEKPLEKYPEVSIIERKLQQNRIYIKKYKQSINKLKDNLKDIKNR
ncbi:MAG: PGF-pre-PGF domain-containing protein, partial [Candidatus Methanoperedens sp.]